MQPSIPRDTTEIPFTKLSLGCATGPRGPHHFPNPSDAMQKRVEWLSHELGYPVEQIAAWGFAGLFLDAWHDSLRNPNDPYPTHVMRCAALLAPLAT